MCIDFLSTRDKPAAEKFGPTTVSTQPQGFFTHSMVMVKRKELAIFLVRPCMLRLFNFFCSGLKCNANLSTFTIICQVTGRCFGNKLSLEFTKQKPSRRKHNALTKHLLKENSDSNPCMNLLAGDCFFLGPLCRTPRLL